MKNYIESLNWRYATKKYDPAKKVSQNDLETLKEAVQLSVSSMGLQPYKVLIIENPEVREQLKAAGYNQDGITESSHLFVFAYEKNVNETHVDAYMENISKVRQVEKESLKPFENMVNGFIQNQTEEGLNAWASKQAYIALSTLINTAALLHIDATPMEGFNAQQFDEILGLDKLGLSTAVIASVGYRHEEDGFQHLKKVRKPENELFITI
ncbi:NAD(P)H-dependent oxidoreductase [Flavobacterium beibuense]|uniref:Nitroreductase n=1 Tax=Flavobacterium beibuense TaxID=657326 RepID=A0A444WJ31_9FLAO|nr:NAD(P)H-dependent oxidoreductase [Flavobacterium beibuense]RYJ45805.1 Nitroreductase [Flavobacterium beibuense]